MCSRKGFHRWWFSGGSRSCSALHIIDPVRMCVGYVLCVMAIRIGMDSVKRKHLLIIYEPSLRMGVHKTFFFAGINISVCLSSYLGHLIRKHYHCVYSFVGLQMDSNDVSLSHSLSLSFSLFVLRGGRRKYIIRLI